MQSLTIEVLDVVGDDIPVMADVFEAGAESSGLDQREHPGACGRRQASNVAAYRDGCREDEVCAVQGILGDLTRLVEIRSFEP